MGNNRSVISAIGITLARETIDEARQNYTFLKDRLPNYRIGVISSDGTG